MHVNRSLLTIALLAGVARAASAQVKLDKHYQLDMDGAVRIHSYNGTITIRGWNKDSVRVTGTIATKDPNIWFGGGRGQGVKMGVDGPEDTAPQADITIMLPARARLSIRGAATTIDIREFAGTVDATTLSGRLHIAGTPTEVMAETMDGDIEIEASPSFLRGRTATGRITWIGSSDDVTMVTVGGSIALSGGTLFRARIETISGDIKFSGGVKPEGRVALDTHSGDITLAFAKSTVAELAYDALRGTVNGADFSRDAKRGGLKYVGIPKGGLDGKVREASVTATSFKGRLTVTQP